MAGKINGFSIAYTAIGGVVLWSGIKGSTISDAFKNIIGGKPVTSDGEETIGAGSGVTADAVASGSNYVTIGQYLMANGYSASGAAGVVGCIAGESGGNPESEATPGNPSGGAGLIQWTGTSYDEYTPAVTGNQPADLSQQLPLILAYNNAQGVGLVAMLNSFPETAAGAVQAADFYSQSFERPAVTDSDVRASIAESVFNELTSPATPGTSSQVTPATGLSNENGYLSNLIDTSGS
jgi:hypothetical protein